MQEQKILFDPSELPLDFKLDDNLPKYEINYLPFIAESKDDQDHDVNEALDGFDD